MPTRRSCDVVVLRPSRGGRADFDLAWASSPRSPLLGCCRVANSDDNNQGKPNRQISAKQPSDYLAAIADKHPERLIAQCIPMDRELWKVDRFQDFLAARRALLATSINELIANP